MIIITKDFISNISKTIKTGDVSRKVPKTKRKQVLK